MERREGGGREKKVGMGEEGKEKWRKRGRVGVGVGKMVGMEGRRSGGGRMSGDGSRKREGWCERMREKRIGR